MKLHQKKFYSSQEVDKIVEKYGKETGRGYSESLRNIVMSWDDEQGTISGLIYLRDFPKSEIKIRG